MYHSEYILENEKHKILLDLKIQTDHLILAIRPDIVIVNKRKTNKKTLQNSRLFFYT